MADFDGSLKFDTMLDNSGFDAGSKELLRAIQNLVSTANNFGQQIGQSFQGAAPSIRAISTSTKQAEKPMEDLRGRIEMIKQDLDNLSGASVQTEEYEKLEAELGEYEAKLSEAAAQKERLEGTNLSSATEMSALSDAEKNISEYSAKIAELSAEKQRLESSGEAYQAGEETAHYKELAAELSKLQEEYRSTQYAAQTADLSAGIQQSAKELDNYLAKTSKMLAVGATDKQWKSTAYDVSVATQKISEYRNQLEGMKNADGIDASKYAELSGVLDQASSSAEEISKVFAQRDFERAAEEKAAAAKKLDEEMKAAAKAAEEFQKKSQAAAAKQMESEINSDANAIDKYQEKVDKMRSMDATDKQWKSTKYDIEQAASELGELQSKLDAMKSSGEISTEDYDRLSSSIADASQNAEGLKKSVNVFTTLGTAMKSVGKQALNVGKSILSIPLKTAASSIKSFAANVQRSISPTNNLAKSLTSVSRMVSTKIKSTFISPIFSSVQEALKSLAQFSDGFNAAMSNMTNSSKELSANLAVGIGGAIQALEPIITGLINLVNAAIVAVNRLFAILRGSSTMTVAKKRTDDYAKSLEKAGGSAAKAEKQLASFDELNILKENDSGGGGSADAADMFEEVELDAPDFSSWGEAFDYLLQTVLDKIPALEDAFVEFDDAVKAWTEKLYDALTFPGVDEKVSEIGRQLANAFNTLVQNFPWDTIGKALGAGLNLALLGLVSFIYKFNWAQLGAGIAESINSIVDEIDWYTVGMLLWAGFKIAIETLAGFLLGLDMADLATAASNIVKGFFDSMTETLEKIPWRKIGEQIATFINNIDFVGIVKSIVSSINGVALALLDLLIGFVENVNWGELGKTLWDSIVAIVENIDWNGLISKAFELLGAVIGGAGALIFGFASQVWEAIKAAFENIKETFFGPYMDEYGRLTIEGFFNGMLDMLSSIATWIYDHIFKPFIDGFKAAFGIASPSTVMEEQGNFVIEGLLNGITAAWENITAFIGTALSDLTGALSDAWEDITGAAKKAWDAISGFLSDTWDDISDTASKVWEDVSGFFSDTWEDMKTGATQAWEAIRKAATEKFEKARSTVTTAAGRLYDTIRTKWDNLRTTTQTKWTNIRDTVTGLWNNLKSTVGAVKWNDIGENLVNGLKSGVTSMWNTLSSKVSELANGLTSTVKNIFGIASPSKQWEGIGEFLTQGLTNGISGENGAVTAAAETMAKSVTGALSDGIENNLYTVTNAAKNMAQAVVNAAKTELSVNNNSSYAFEKIGYYIDAGLAKGMSDNVSTVTGAVKSVVQSAKSTAEMTAQVKSPSKVFAKIGGFLSLGLAEGIEEEEPVVLRTVRNLANAAAGEMEGRTMNVSTVGVDAAMSNFSTRISDGLAALVETLQAIADRVTFQIPSIAAGTVAPYRVAAAAEAPGATYYSVSNGGGYDDSDLMDMLQELLSAVKSKQKMYLDGMEVTKAVKGNMDIMARSGRWRGV